MNKINNIGLVRELTSCYDFKGFTEQEVWSRIAQKINIIIEHFNYLDKKIENEKANNKAKFDYLLGEGLSEQVAKALLEKIIDGTIGELINDTLLKDINTKVNEFKETFTEQLDKITYFATLEMFGAKGDGVTDDTEAFNSFLLSNFNTLYLKSDVYKITNTLTINRPIKIIGNTIQRRETNRPYLDFSKCVNEYALKIEVSGVKLEDFNIKGNRDLTTGIYTNYNSRFDFNNLGLYYCKNAISLTRAYNITMNNIVFEFNDNCIVLDGVCTSISMNGLIFYSSTNGFISKQELDYSVMNSCGFDHCDNAITLYNNYANNLLLNNCGFEDYIIGLYAMGNSNVIINGLTCVNTERTTDTFKGGGKITYIGGRADILKLPNKSDVIFISPITPTTPTDITIRDLPISVNAYTNVPIKNFNIINTINTVNNESYFNVNKTNDSFYFILDIEAISNDGIETVKLGFYNSTLFNDNLDFIETSITDNGYKITFKKDCNIKIIGRLYNCKIN